LATSHASAATYYYEGQQLQNYAHGRKYCRAATGERPMLWTITIILFILWVVGLVSSYTMGGWSHILLVLAIIVLIFNLLSGRRAL
jgi:uncharacterized protein (DUF983 family)